MGENTTFRARRAPLLAEGAPYLFRMTPSWANRAPFCMRIAPSLAGRRPYNALGAKIDLELRDSANEDEDCRPRRGASYHWGGAASHCSSPWIRPCLYVAS